MKRYILFAGSRYYPNGGCEDIVNHSDMFQDLVTYYLEKKDDECWGWANILDTKTGEKIDVELS